MSRLEHGFRRAVTEIVGGIVFSAIMVAFASSGLIPDSFVLIFHLLNVLSTILLIFTIPFWTTSYIIGWLFGLWIMSSSGLIGILELLIYLVPLVILVIRGLKSIAGSE